MRYSELTNEAAVDSRSIETDITHYLLRAKAKGMTSVPTAIIVNDLNGMTTYDGISTSTVVNILKNKSKFPFVVNVSIENIDLSIVASNNKTAQTNRNTVRNLAKSATKKRM